MYNVEKGSQKWEIRIGVPVWCNRIRDSTNEIVGFGEQRSLVGFELRKKIHLCLWMYGTFQTKSLIRSEFKLRYNENLKEIAHIGHVNNIYFV